MNSNCSNLLNMRNLQEQVKKAFCYQKLLWPFTAWINCSSGLKNFAISRPSASNSKSFSRSREQFFLTVDQNNFGNKYQSFLHFSLFMLLRLKVTLRQNERKKGTDHHNATLFLNFFCTLWQSSTTFDLDNLERPLWF